MNTYGDIFRLTTYGESHGLAVGAVIDGCPSGVRLDMELIARQLARRRHGAPRSETDEVEWLSGLQDCITLGTPLAFLVRNTNTQPDDYTMLEHMFRPGHADYTYFRKYGIRDHRGGGRSSARETVARVVAGSIAQQLMPEIGISTVCQTAEAPSNDTRGGCVCCRIAGVPAGIGEPIFDKLNANLAAAMMSIPSAIGFEMGIGFQAAQMTGREYIDRWSGNRQYGAALTTTNHCGGIQGGISNGMPIEFRVAFHPVVTIPQPTECMHEDGRLETVSLPGRHDRNHICRAAVVVESMAALCMVNYILKETKRPEV